MVGSQISESSVLDTYVVREDYPENSMFLAARQCSLNPWCHAVCRLTDSRLVLTSLEISGGFSIAPAGDKITCYTKRRRVLYPHQSTVTTGSDVYHGAPTKNKEKISDGVYNGLLGNCFYGYLGPPHLLIEFSSQVPISTVTLRSQPGGYLLGKFKNIEVRVGNSTPPSGDFSQFELLGTLKDSQF